MLVRKLLNIALFSTCVVSVVSAADDIRYDVGASVGKSEYNGDNDAAFANIGGSITVPVSITDIWGVSFSGSAGASRADYSYSGSSGNCDATGASIGASVFAHAPDVGRIRAAYSKSRGSSSCSGGLSSESDTSDSTSYGLLAEYYLDPLTFGATRSRLKADSSGTSDTASVFAKWYPDKNISLGLSAGALDADDTQSLSLEFQPEMFGNSTSVSAAYGNTPDSDTVALGIRYYFGNRVDLRTRDRQPR